MFTIVNTHPMIAQTCPLSDSPIMFPWVGSLVAPPSRSLRLMVETSREARELVTLRFFDSDMEGAQVDIVRKRTLGMFYKRNKLSL